jgi:formylglycine-generating enzyme required for sulfatase activity
VTLGGFWIEPTLVTNEQFARFVDATGYVTLAERPRNPVDYPDAQPERLKPGGLVFQKPPGPVEPDHDVTSWVYVPGADWRHPRGPDSSLAEQWTHPVVQIAYEDAEAYAAWAGKSLPTEAEWEYAARGGLEGAIFTWGNAESPNCRPMANTWQGVFPCRNLLLDGFEETSPVGAFPPNGYGLYDMTGNVWEWTADWYVPRHPVEPAEPYRGSLNPRGGTREQSFDPFQPWQTFPRKVIKGGSYLCAPNHDFRYRPAARQAESLDTASGHLGFRCIVRASDSHDEVTRANGRRPHGSAILEFHLRRHDRDVPMDDRHP